MPFLPPELVEDVLEHIYYDTNGQVDRNTLSCCSLVCYSWAKPAQKLLFHHVDMRATGFRISVITKSIRASHLGSFVRSLQVGVTGQNHPRYSLEANSFLTVNAFIHLLSVCPNLYELALRVQSLYQFDQATLDSLTGLATRPSNHNGILDHAIRPAAFTLIECGIQSPIIYQILSIWPCIQFLRLQTEINAPPPRDAPKFKLYELSLIRVLARIETIHWLLSTSEGHLRILDFRDAPGSEYKAIFSTHGRHLQSVRFFRQDLTTSSLLALCPNLRELVIMQVSSYIPLKNVPESVEHFSFRDFAWGMNDTLEPVIELIKKLPNLKVVSCDFHANVHKDMPELRRICSERDVEVISNLPGIIVFEDPVPLGCLPRGKTVLNFPLMNKESR
ncbi:hypothetical protein C8Q75DRAFT_245434 [Abortiporus biennis]|nr:hypothetical protein C8Q75DRAFT_245434 [Abortiporus biennis]